MYEKARFSFLVEFDAWNSHETSVCGTQRAVGADECLLRSHRAGISELGLAASGGI